MQQERQHAYIALALVSFFWGTTYVAARIGAQQMPGLFMAGIRQLVSGLILVLYFLVKGYRLPKLTELKQISMQGVFLLCIANGLLSWSLEYISGGLAAIIVALVPLFIALFNAWYSGKRKPGNGMMAGLLIGFAGILLIFSDYRNEWKQPGFLFGAGLALVSVLSWSFGTVYCARQKSGTRILFSAGLQMLIAGAIMLPVCMLTGRYSNLAETGVKAWAALLYLIVFGSLIAYSAYVYALKTLPPSRVALYAYINPLVAVAMGWLLLAEKMNGVMVLGIAVTLAGVYVVNRETKTVQP